MDGNIHINQYYNISHIILNDNQEQAPHPDPHLQTHPHPYLHFHPPIITKHKNPCIQKQRNKRLHVTPSLTHSKIAYEPSSSL